MEFTEKRKAKRLAVIFITLAYIVITAWTIVCVYGIIRIFIIEDVDVVVVTSWMMWLIGVAPIVLALSLSVLAQRYVWERLFYQKAIAEYRQCRFFTTSIQKILAGDKKSRDVAVDYYDLLIEDTPRRRFMFAFILAANYYSKDKKTAAEGKERLEIILETYDPEKVVMSK